MAKQKYLQKKVYIYTDDTGKRHFRSIYGKTQKELDKKVRQFKNQLEENPYYYLSADTFYNWGEKWIKHISVHGHKGKELGENQVRAYKGYIKYFYDALGNMKLNEICRDDIQKVIDDLAIYNPITCKPTAKSTLDKYRCTVRQVFEYAIASEAIGKNPANNVDIPAKADKSERRALSPKERQMIINTPHRRGRQKNGTAKDYYGMQLPAMIMLFAGLRRGEVIPLQWSDIDFENGTISITKAIYYKSNQPILKQPKTKNSVRIVHMNNILINYLKRVYSSISVYNFNNLVCPSLNGEMYTQTAWRAAWKSYMLDLDVKYGSDKEKTSKYQKNLSAITIETFTPHCLRHTFGSMLNEAGVNIKTIQSEMGHADIKTTMNIYVHENEEHQKTEMKKYSNAV